MRRLQYNSPVVLSFALISLAVLLLGELTGGESTRLLFTVYRSSYADPLTYLRVFLYVLGHSSYSHYFSNMLLFLVLGPQIEERYGSKNLLAVMAITAVISGAAQMIFFPGIGLLGASGIVFMMISLASLGGMKSGKIPLTLILVLAIYLGGEIYEGINSTDNISQLTHIIGGVCGAGAGLLMRNHR